MQRILIFALTGLIALALSGVALAAPAKPVATATAKATVAPTATPVIVPTATPKPAPTATPRLQPTPPRPLGWWGKYTNKGKTIWVGEFANGCPNTYQEFTFVIGSCTQTRPY